MNKCLTRVTVDKRDWDRRERERLEELNEKIEKEKLEMFIKEKETAAAIIMDVKQREMKKQPLRR